MSRTSPADEHLVEVRILGLPIALQRATSACFDELLREFFHLSGDSTSVPARLRALRDDIAGRFDAYTAAARESLLQAERADERTVDLTYLVPLEVVDAAGALDSLLDEADAFCAEGALLTLAMPPPLVAFRRWYLGEFVRQSRGGAPLRWSEPTS